MYRTRVSAVAQVAPVANRNKKKKHETMTTIITKAIQLQQE